MSSPGVADPHILSAPPARAAGHRGHGFNSAIHGLRGLASVMVFAAHVAGGTARHIYPHDEAYVRLVRHPWVLGTFGVELFFVISGFVILPSALKYDLGGFAARRFVRIYPLFLALSLLFILLNQLTARYDRVNDLASIVSGLTFLNIFTGRDQLTPNAWSLSFEAWFYVLTALVVTFAIKRHHHPAGSVAIALAAAFLWFFPISTFFLIGIAVRVLLPRDRAATAGTRAVEAIAIVALVWSASRDHHDFTSWLQFRDPVVAMILASIFAYFITAALPGSLTATALGGPLFGYLGTISYSLYLVHPFAYFTLRLLFVHFGWFGEDVWLSMAAFAGAVFALAFPVTSVVHAVLERGPYLAVFHQNVFHRDRARPA